MALAVVEVAVGAEGLEAEGVEDDPVNGLDFCLEEEGDTDFR